MADAARARLAEASGATPAAAVLGDIAQDRGALARPGVGRFALAASLTMTLAMMSGRPALAATPPSELAVSPRSANQPGVTANPAIPADADPTLMHRPPRPDLRDHASRTAALDAPATDAGQAPTPGRAGASGRAAAPLGSGARVNQTLMDEARIAPGFARPADLRMSLGRLAKDIPAARTQQSFVKYAALRQSGHHHAAKKRAVRKHATAGHRAKSGKAHSSARLHGRISTGHATMSCLPTDLKRVLNQVAANFGPIRVNSTHRSHSHNRRVGGAPRSLHLECRAVDFSYHGSRRGALIRFLRSHSDVGGVGVYGGSGHIHIDDGPRRSW